MSRPLSLIFCSMFALLLPAARTEEPKPGGAIDLFNGKDLTGW